MSKLNDSTLKILKKYRLDTDMSVFGNENKLYDVVKVMDDMVGNQVSKYVGDSYYFSSTNTTTYQAYLAKSDGFTKNGSFSNNVRKPNSKRIYFDPLSLKFLGSIEAGSSVIPACQILKNNNVVGYVGINIDDKSILIYEELKCINVKTLSVVSGDIISFRGVLCFSNEEYSPAVGAFYFYDLFDFEYQNNRITVPATTHSIIALPEQLNLLDFSQRIYCNEVSYPSSLSVDGTYKVKYNINFAEV